MIIFITGGTGSGKSSFAKKMEAELLAAEAGAVVVIVDNFSVKLREWLFEDRDYMALTESRLGEAKAGVHLIIVVEELGCGLVPLDAREREYREVNGRVACMIAQNADRVYRMIAGIAQRIK